MVCDSMHMVPPNVLLPPPPQELQDWQRRRRLGLVDVPARSPVGESPVGESPVVKSPVEEGGDPVPLLEPATPGHGGGASGLTTAGGARAEAEQAEVLGYPLVVMRSLVEQVYTWVQRHHTGHVDWSCVASRMRPRLQPEEAHRLWWLVAYTLATPNGYEDGFYAFEPGEGEPVGTGHPHTKRKRAGLPASLAQVELDRGPDLDNPNPSPNPNPDPNPNPNPGGARLRLGPGRVPQQLRKAPSQWCHSSLPPPLLGLARQAPGRATTPRTRGELPRRPRPKGEAAVRPWRAGRTRPIALRGLRYRRYSRHMSLARDRDRVAMDVGNAKQPKVTLSLSLTLALTLALTPTLALTLALTLTKTPRTGTEWPLAGTPRLPARAYPPPAGVVWPKLHEDGRGPLNLGLPPPHSKKVAQVNEGAEGAYTLKEAMRLTVQSRPWNEVRPPVGSGFWVAPQPGTAQHAPASSDRPGWF